MQTIAQKKAKINGWIKEYQNRIEKYKQKYGEDSFKSKLYQRSCFFKIASWRKDIEALNKRNMIDKFAVAKFILSKSEEYFGRKINFGRDGKRANLNQDEARYYLSKFIVDSGLCGEDSCIALKATRNRMYQRRDILTKSIEHKNTYRAYRLTIEAQLLANKIQWR